jgi:D-lactate dehydrogenase
MAGDRGFLFPELTASATYGEAKEVRQKKYDGYYSTTITCEMALSEAVKENYVSVLYLIDEAVFKRRVREDECVVVDVEDKRQNITNR